MKPGRNDPCPCGSGKKYKHCCLTKDSAPPAGEFLWRKLRQLNEGLAIQLLDTAVETFGKEAIDAAWNEFTSGEDIPFEPQSPHGQVFWPWFYYDWRPDPEGAPVKPGAPLNLTVAGAYLNKQGQRLDPLARRYLQACEAAPFSFHEIVACEPGSGFVLRDLILGEQRHVVERMGSRNAEPGFVLFGKVVVLDDLAQIDGCSPVLFPPIEKGPIIALRKQIALASETFTPGLLKQYDPEMFAIYLDIAERLLNPAAPELRNTDGDALLFHKILYAIDSPQDTFDALKGLALDATDEELLAQAERNRSGALRKIEFAWLKRGNQQHKHWNNTILGQVCIEDNQLTVEVNSAKRAKEFVALAKKLLGENARYRTTVIESPEAKLAHARPDRADPSGAEHEALLAQPEVQAALAKQLEGHYDNWLNEKIPLLGNKTPRQAVKTADGREMVEALLTQFEHDMRKQKMPGNEALIRSLRLRLNLPER